MRLIIDIPKDLYKATVNGLKADEIWDLRLAVKNGTPLDDVKVEIEQGYCIANNDYDKGRNYGLYMATQILNNIGKAESEDE